MNTLLTTLLLSSSLFAELYECKNAFLNVQSNSITIVAENNETFHARRGYGALSHITQDCRLKFIFKSGNVPPV